MRTAPTHAHAIHDALLFIRGRSRGDLDYDAMLFRALVNRIKVIGEAASRTTAETRSRLPAIPWVQITAMRNRLIHAYYDINRDAVWATVVHDLPMLEAELRSALGPDRPKS